MPNSTTPQTNAEMEIDLVEVFKAIVRGRLPIAIALALSVALAAIYCFQFLPDVYSATTSLYVLNQIDQTVISSSDLSSSALLVNDYREIITSRRVTGAVAEELNLENLQDFTIEVEAPTDTRIIEVTVTGEDPELVMEVANGLAQEFSRYVVSIMRIDNVSIIDEALLPDAPAAGKVYHPGGDARGDRYHGRARRDRGLLHVPEVRRRCGKADRHPGSRPGGLGGPGEQGEEEKEKEACRMSAETNASVLELYYGDAQLRDSIKTLRTNIEFAGIDKRIKSVAVTSADVGAGKSMISICLAVAMAESGRRTLLIDDDFRHPQIANRMGIRCRYSLSDLLAGNIAINSVCVPTEIPNLYVFDSGNRRISNPVEVLSSIRYKEVLNELYDAFDFLIIDTPPVGLFVDAAVISSQVEGVLVVIQKGKTKREAVRAAMSQLEKANAHVLGAVLNGASHTSSDYYYYHYGDHRRGRGAHAPREAERGDPAT